MNVRNPDQSSVNQNTRLRKDSNQLATGVSEPKVSNSIPRCCFSAVFSVPALGSNLPQNYKYQ